MVGLTVQANADRAYTGILDLADLIDSQHLADHVAVFRRGEAAPRYQNALSSAGQWQAVPALRTAIDGERAHGWTAEETADFLRTHTKLRRELGPQWTPRLDEILHQAQQLMGQPARTAASSDASAPGLGPADAAGVIHDKRSLKNAATADTAEVHQSNRPAVDRPTTIACQPQADWQPDHPGAEPDVEPEAGL